MFQIIHNLTHTVALQFAVFRIGEILRKILSDNSIVNQDTDFKGYEQSFEEMQREILRQLDPSWFPEPALPYLLFQEVS